MHFSPSLKNCFAFLALLFICHELHELMHTTVAYFLCGCWGERDFVGWRTCQACPAGVSTTFIFFVGPLFSYALMWVAYFLMASSRTTRQKAIGFALFFANLPFGRILPVLDREGDESLITRNLINKESMTVLSWGTEIAVVLLLTVPVLLRAWRLLNKESQLFVVATFLGLPLLAESVFMNQWANWFLQQGVLSGAGVLGSPVLLNVWNGLWLLVLLLTFRSLFTLLSPAKEEAPAAKKATAKF